MTLAQCKNTLEQKLMWLRKPKFKNYTTGFGAEFEGQIQIQGGKCKARGTCCCRYTSRSKWA